MAEKNTLGSLVVDLKANTAGFVGDLGKAARAAENLGKDINRSFSGLAKIASATFGAFGPAANQAISTISTGIAQVGRNAASAAKDLGKVHGALGLVGAVGAGAATALGLVAVGALEIARRTSESIDKLNEQAQALSIDIEALSSLGLAAKQSGISQEGLGKALQGMSRSAFAASTAATGTANAYTRLGISVKNQDGSFKNQLQLFRDITARLAAMPDGFQKTALAGQVFSKGLGGSILVMANMGTKLDETIELSERLGLVISKETAAAADKFQDTLKEIGGAVEGVTIKLMERLLPALQRAADGFRAWLGDDKNIKTLNEMADGAATLGRLVLNAASAYIFLGRVLDALNKPPQGLLDTPRAFRAMTSEIRDATAELKEYWATSQQGMASSAAYHAAMRQSAQRALQNPFQLVSDGATDAQKKIDGMLKALRTGAETFGLSAGATEAYKLKLEGASQAEQQLGASIAQRIFVMKEAAKQMPKPLGLNLFRPEYDPGAIKAPEIPQIMPEVNLEAVGALNTLGASLKEQARILNQENRPAIEKYRDAMGLLVEMQKEGGLSAQAFEIEADKLKQQLQASDPVVMTVRQSMSQMFSQAIIRAGSLREAFAGVLQRIAEVILEVKVLDPLLKNLGTSGGGGGGILGFLGGLGKSILGGLGGGLSIGGALPLTRPGGFGMLAGGGPVSAGQSYIVGEKGPELFTAPRSGQIMANGSFGSAGSASVVYNIDARGATDPAATAMAVQRAIERSKQEAITESLSLQQQIMRRTPSGSFA